MSGRERPNQGSFDDSPTELLNPSLTRREKRLEAVLFDVGGTLVDTRDYAGWAEVARGIQLALDAEDLARGWQSASAMSAPGSFEEQWKVALEVAAGRSLPQGVIERFLRALESAPRGGLLFSDVRKCLDRLRADQRRLGVVSNSPTEEGLRDLLDRLGVLASFEVIVASGSAGPRKPSREIFIRATTRLGLAPNSVLFVGDSLEQDVRGATAVGMPAVWLNRGGFGEDHSIPEVLSLSEVPRVVRELDGRAGVK
jgi:putative hydrolase of the HAD superfamily